jgi:hypothetical protein
MMWKYAESGNYLMNLSIQPSKIYQSSVKHCICVLCKRRIKRDSKHVAGLGPVGSECYKHVANFDAWMKKHQLEGLASGGIIITAQEIREKSVDHLLTRRAELMRAGLHVFSTRLENGDIALTLGKIHTRSAFFEAQKTTFAEVAQ